LAEIINQTNSGVVIDFDQRVLLKKAILELYTLYKNGNCTVKSHNIEQFHRKQLTKKVAELIHNIIK
jgi:hypothetical protein